MMFIMMMLWAILVMKAILFGNNKFIALAKHENKSAKCCKSSYKIYDRTIGLTTIFVEIIFGLSLKQNSN